MKPICVPCERFFRVKKNGFYFVEAMPKQAHALPGRVEPEKWTPYKIWAGDLWQCPSCHAQIISGTGSSAISEHFKEGFDEKVKRLGANQLQVNDC